MGKLLILLWLVIGFFSNLASAQTIKLGVRGGTFSPISLYEALAKKNSNANLNSFSTSRPYSLSLGATVEKQRWVYCANTSIRRVDIHLTYSDGYYPSHSFLETYDFDVSAGYKVVQTPKSSLNAIVGFGVQTRNDFVTGANFYLNRTPQTEDYVRTSFHDEIKPVSKVPAFLLLKVEGEFALSNRWFTFFTIESNLFFGRNYFLRNTSTFQNNEYTMVQQSDGVRFSNNSISSTLGFRYALFKGNS